MKNLLWRINMSDNFKYSEWRKNENIKRYEIPNVEDYFEDLMNIEHSFSGRMDIPLANTFIMEAVQLVVNSIALFELGYFDNAYYSLREAIEISTTIVYLSDMPDEERQQPVPYFPLHCGLQGSYSVLPWHPADRQGYIFRSKYTGSL